MLNIIQLTLAVAALIALAPEAHGQSSMNVTPVETAQLPRFCWAQLAVPGASGDDFRIRDCGPAANHYCSALIYMVRARKYKADKKGLLRNADIDIAYTEDATANYPNCSIREHMKATRIELDNLMVMYGFKQRPKPK
jgi:hypothetical protein